MKNSLLILAITMLFSFTKCNNASSDKLCSNAETRGKVISELMNNETYMKEVMDSMRKKHPDYIFSTVFFMSKDDKKMQADMMDNMAKMCKTDSSMANMMRGKMMMDMDDENTSCCKVGAKMMNKTMAMMGDMPDCCKNGKMKMGKTGKMSNAEKAKCCMMGSKKLDSNMK